MTFVTDLTLSHFRSHRLSRLSLDGRPVALFGPNGAGKTNVLEAVSLLSPGRGLRRAAAEDCARRPESLGWKIAARFGGHDVETRWEGGSGRTVEIDGKATPQLALGRLIRVVWLVPAMDRLWTESAEGRRRFLDRIALSFEPAHGEAALSYEKAMRERNRLLKEQVWDAGWYAALERQMAQAGAKVVRHRCEAVSRITEAQASAETVFPAADLIVTGPSGAPPPETESALLDAWADTRRADLAAGRTLIGPHRADLTALYAAKGINARDASTGEQKALLLSLVLSNARALAQDFEAPPLLLLDEVAAHLDASRRAALFDEICALGTQAWMTGTGAELFDAIGDRAQQFEVTDNTGTSELLTHEKNVWRGVAPGS